MLVGHNVLSGNHPDRVQSTALYIDDNAEAASYALATSDPFCRLGDKGNPSAEHLANKVNALPLNVINVGVLNELNLVDVEQYPGTPDTYAQLLSDLKDRVGANRRLWAMAPSPDSPLWGEYLKASHKVTGLQQLHCYGVNLDRLKYHYDKQKAIIGSSRIRVTECNAGWGNTVDRDKWADEALKPFLDFLSTDPLVESVYYFAWEWPHPDTPGTTPVDAIGTRIATVVDTWVKPVVVVPPKPPVVPPVEPGGVTRRNVPTRHYSSRQGRKPLYYIIHSTGPARPTSFEASHKWLVENPRQVSAHKLIGHDIVITYAPDTIATHHVGGSRLPNGSTGLQANQDSYGVELYQTAPGKPVAPYIVELAIAEAIDDCKRMGIPAKNVLGHWQVDLHGKVDPVGVQMDIFRARVAAGLLSEARDWPKAKWHIEERVRVARGIGDIEASETLLYVVLPWMEAKSKGAPDNFPLTGNSEDWDKTMWHAEQGAVFAREVGDLIAYDTLADEVLPWIEKRRDNV